MPVIGGNERPTTGRVFFVDSTSATKGNDTAHGSEPTAPFSTLDFAIGQCTANRGDRIYVLAGHAETVLAAAGISIDVAGVEIVGLSEGASRPTFSFTTSVAASIDFGAASCVLRNVILDLTGIDAITAGINLKAADCILENCEIIQSDAGGQALIAVLTDSNASRCRIINNQFIGSTDAGPNSCIKLGGSPDRVSIIGNRILGNFADAGIFNVAGSVAIHTNLFIAFNTIQAYGSTQYGINILETLTTGIIAHNDILVTDLSIALINFSCAAIGNFGYDTDTTNAGGVEIPIVGAQLGTGTSLLNQIIGADFSYNRANYFEVTADFSSATWNTVAAHEIVTVTGAVRVKIIPRCTSSITAGGAITLILGTETTTDGLILSTDATTIDSGMFWLTATPSHLAAHSSTVPLDFIIANGQDIGYTVGTSAGTGGTILFDVWWEAISSNGNCVAGAGGVL